MLRILSLVLLTFCVCARLQLAQPPGLARTLANRLYSQNSRARRWISVCQRTQQNEQAGLSDGTTLGSCINFTYVADYNGLGLRVAFWNGYGLYNASVVGSAELPCPNAVTVQWGYWQYANSTYTYFPGTFGGANSLVVQPGQFIESDPLAGVPIVKGSSYLIAFRCTVPSGSYFPCSYYHNWTQNGGDGDLVDNGGGSHGGAVGAITTRVTTGLQYGENAVMPLRVETCVVNPVPQMISAGDSLIDYGNFSLGSTAWPTPFNAFGYLRAMCRGTADLQSFAMGSDTAANSIYPSWNYRLGLFDWLSGSPARAYVAYGTNDIGSAGTAALTTPNILTIANQFANAGIRPVLGTQLPRAGASDTDWYANPSEQSAYTNAAQRQLLQMWMRFGGGATYTATGGSTTTLTFAATAALPGTLNTICWLTGSNAGTYSTITSRSWAANVQTYGFSATGSSVEASDTFYVVIAPVLNPGAPIVGETPPAPFEQAFDSAICVATAWNSDIWANGGYVTSTGAWSPSAIVNTPTTITATGGSTTTATFASVGSLAGQFTYMVILWTGGLNAGTYSQITASSTAASVATTTFATLANAVQSGDTFEVIIPYTGDGLHPNLFGAAYIAYCLTSQLQAWLNAP